MLQKLEKAVEKQGGAQQPELLSTHPLTQVCLNTICTLLLLHSHVPSASSLLYLLVLREMARPRLLDRRHCQVDSAAAVVARICRTSVI